MWVNSELLDRLERIERRLELTAEQMREQNAILGDAVAQLRWRIDQGHIDGLQRTYLARVDRFTADLQAAGDGYAEQVRAWTANLDRMTEAYAHELLARVPSEPAPLPAHPAAAEPPPPAVPHHPEPSEREPEREPEPAPAPYREPAGFRFAPTMALAALALSLAAVAISLVPLVSGG